MTLSSSRRKQNSDRSELLGRTFADEFTLSDLADRVDINLASCHALLAVLTDVGYVSRNPRLKTYSLGSVLVALGNAAVRRHPAIEHAHGQARQLSEDLGLTVTVTALAGQDIAFLERVGNTDPGTSGCRWVNGSP